MSRDECATSSLFFRRAAGVLALGCAISLTTLSRGTVAAFADPPVPAPAPPPATLTLAPAEGSAGTQVTATTTGFGYCLDSPHLRWDDQPLPASDSLAFTVPDGPTGAHTVTAVCRVLDGGRVVASATFTVVAIEKPALTLDSGKGPAGFQVTAAPTGFGTCLDSPHLLWDDQPLPARIGDASIGSLALTVPDGPTGAHTVTAVCRVLDGARLVASATFTVVATEKPTLTLDTGEGPAGSQLTATGAGFECRDSGSVQLLWDGDRPPLTKAPSGTFTVPLTVPSKASTGEHTVVASCADDPDITASQPFTVTSPVTNLGTGPASMSLDPTRGHPGDPVQVVGRQFSCANHSRTVELSWDDAPSRFEASLDGAGHFDTWFSVPSDAEASSHTVRASCSDESAWAASDFTVVAVGLPVPPPITSPPSTPPPIIPPPQHHHWWVLVLIAGAIVVLVVAAAYHLSHRPPRPPRVRAVARPGGPAVVTVRETPAHGEATHAIRVAVHTHPDTVTLREVDDDHACVE